MLQTLLVAHKSGFSLPTSLFLYGRGLHTLRKMKIPSLCLFSPFGHSEHEPPGKSSAMKLSNVTYLKFASPLLLKKFGLFLWY
jgi:hypothetical protein